MILAEVSISSRLITLSVVGLLLILLTDEWIRRKIRVIKRKQCKHVYTIACFLRDEGVREDQAFMVAGAGKGWWRLSKTRESHRAMGKEWFRKMGLVSLQSIVCNG